eukprot:2058541-Pyramimonas_sp.AAC.1
MRHCQSGTQTCKHTDFQYPFEFACPAPIDLVLAAGSLSAKACTRRAGHLVASHAHKLYKLHCNVAATDLPWALATT